MDVAQSGYRVRTGIDLVPIEEFRRSLDRGGEAMRNRLFLQTETIGASLERLAGMFAAKEAAFKALSLPSGDCHVLAIRRRTDGRPYIELRRDYDSSHIDDIDLSISHAGGYAVASVVALVRREHEGSQE